MDLMLISTPVEYNTGKGLATEEKTEQLYSYVACTYTNCQQRGALEHNEPQLLHTTAPLILIAVCSGLWFD